MCFSHQPKCARDGRGDAGFTLIELIVVMIIMSILAAIALPIFVQQRRRAVDTTLRTDLRTIASAMEAGTSDDDRYPAAATIVLTGSVLTIESETYRVSEGTQVQSFVNASGSQFCIGVYNERGSALSAARSFWYSSAGGGVLAGNPSAKPAICP